MPWIMWMQVSVDNNNVSAFESRVGAVAQNWGQAIIMLAEFVYSVLCSVSPSTPIFLTKVLNWSDLIYCGLPN